MAACAAADQGHRVTVIEKNEKAGKKIYITGKGRCNLTNDCGTEEFFDHVVRNPKFLYSSVYGFDHEAVKLFFEENGCPVKTERGLRVFPASDHSYDVTDALMRHLKRKRVSVRFHTPARSLVMETENGDRRKITGVRLGNESVLPADSVILCTGGLSYPSTGSTGDGHRMAAEAGHDIVSCLPSLVPMETAEHWPLELQGLSLKNVSVSIRPLESEPERAGGKKRRPVYSGFGEMLFTHFGLSGPLILTGSASCDFTQHPNGFRLLLDLKPAISKEELENRIRSLLEEAPERRFSNAVAGLFPLRLRDAAVQLSGISPERAARSIQPGEIREFAALLKSIPLTLRGNRGFREAIITRGGVSVREVDPSTMESRLVRGLFFAGEILDVDAVTGGFNLQIAWSTGHLAGESVR